MTENWFSLLRASCPTSVVRTRRIRTDYAFGAAQGCRVVDPVNGTMDPRGAYRWCHERGRQSQTSVLIQNVQWGTFRCFVLPAGLGLPGVISGFPPPYRLRFRSRRDMMRSSPSTSGPRNLVCCAKWGLFSWFFRFADQPDRWRCWWLQPGSWLERGLSIW